MKSRPLGLSAFVLLLLLASPVGAQYINRSYNNPGTNTPSARVGNVGGVATRAGGLGLPRGSRAVNSAGGRSFGGFGGGRVAAAQALAPAYVGLIGGGAPGTGSNPYVARQVSGLGSLLSLTAPWNGRRVLAPPMSRTPYFAPHETRSSFEEYFQLSKPPAAPSAELSAGERLAPAYEIMKNDTAREADERRQAVIKSFRDAMTRRPEGNAAELLAVAEALDLQTAVHRDWLLGRLMRLHVALELDQAIVAMYCLKSAVQSDGGVFAEIPTLEPYFPDKTVRQDQLRRFLRIGDDVGASPDAYALQAYCAWQLGEVGRARAALQKLRTLTGDADTDPRTRAVATALSGAVEK